MRRQWIPMNNFLQPSNRQGAEPGCRGPGPWLKLAAGLVIILLFMLLIGPIGLKLPGYSEMARLVDEQNIRANAIYYTDLEEFARADAAVKDSLAYPPMENRVRMRPARGAGIPTAPAPSKPRPF